MPDAEGVEKKSCENFVLWDKKKCCAECHRRSSALPFRLKFENFDCRMCCRAAQWATMTFHAIDVIEAPDEP